MNNPLVQPDPGLFIWTILTFLVLLTLLAKFAWQPLLQALDARQQAIKQSLEEAQRAREEMQRVQNESAAMMQAARVEAEALVARTRADLERFKEDMKTKARAEAAQILQNGEREIELQTARAMRQVRHEVIELSVLVASKLLQRNITKEDNLALIDDTIKQFDAKH